MFLKLVAKRLGSYSIQSSLANVFREGVQEMGQVNVCGSYAVGLHEKKSWTHVEVPLDIERLLISKDSREYWLHHLTQYTATNGSNLIDMHAGTNRYPVDDNPRNIVRLTPISGRDSPRP